jgi:hypothetical protein
MAPVPFLAILSLLVGSSAPALTPECLVHMGKDELEALYRKAPAAPVLDGYFAGRSTKLPHATGLVWKGKQFCAADMTIVNHWCLGLTAIKANVYPGESWLDGKPALIMDYRGSSKVWHNVRDELREVCPGLYLGIMYREQKCGPKLVQFFVLEYCAK